MYKIFFGNRYLNILSTSDNISGPFSEHVVFCKNKKSFDKVYEDFVQDENIFCLTVFCPKPSRYFKHLLRKFKIIKAAGGFVENHKGEILVIKRHGVWDLPKGKVEENEKKRETALREVIEECGIDNLIILEKIANTYHTYFIDNIQVLKITSWYKMLYSSNALPVPQTEEGISEIKWVNTEELYLISANTYPNLRAIFDIKLKP
jgi:8-oxo-dGTP pyrophosphatase MutT (NUDIX family)